MSMEKFLMLSEKNKRNKRNKSYKTSETKKDVIWKPDENANIIPQSVAQISSPQNAATLL